MVQKAQSHVSPNSDSCEVAKNVDFLFPFVAEENEALRN